MAVDSGRRRECGSLRRPELGPPRAAPTPAVDGVAARCATTLAISAEVRAQAAQAQASALVIGLAPIGFTALACLADHRTASFLFQTPAGLACLAVGGALDAAGAMWMARITRTDA
jgi:Flp pilus assembly protein TadB